MARHLITEAGTVRSVVEVHPGVVGSALLAGLLLGEAEAPPRVAVLTQPGAHHVAAEVARSLRTAGSDTGIEVLPDREAGKTLAVVEQCYLWLNAMRLTRGDLVVGVGGGALTDVAGFVAATYLRGVGASLVPTTLLGAVDASIGGKTGINVGGKNLAGAFSHPRRVVIDTDLLEGIPRPLIREGSAEAVKAGLIGDLALVELYEERGLDAPLDEVVDRAVAVKARIVSADFTEQDQRAWLNYGHTVGHAVEVALGIPHGEAVSVGMVAAAEASRLVTGFGDSERQRHVIERLRLPTDAGAAARERIVELMALDKKRDRTGLRMTLLREIADPVLMPVDAATVDAALRAIAVR